MSIRSIRLEQYYSFALMFCIGHGKEVKVPIDNCSASDILGKIKDLAEKPLSETV